MYQLDATLAVRFGIVPASTLTDATSTVLTLEDGVAKYLAHVGRPRVVGGASGTTATRYKDVFDKFVPYAKSRGITTWYAVTQSTVHGYTAWLEDNDYAYATQTLEVTTLIQIKKWLVSQGMLPSGSELKIKVEKSNETTTYCYTAQEVTAMLDHCREADSLAWMFDVITILSHTGMRISELQAARWADIEDSFKSWVIPDDSKKGSAKDRRVARTNKGRRTRRIPIHERVREVLLRLHTKRRKDGLIMHGPRGGVLKPDRVRIVLQRDVLVPVSETLGIDASARGGSILDGRLHSFRHFFCSQCANRGVPEQVLMGWLGHTDSDMIRHYYHLRDDESQRRMEEMRFDI